MATALQVLDTARSHLNDPSGDLWWDSKLMPKLQEAHRELQLRLVLAGVPVMSSVTTVLSVPTNTLDLTTVVGYPTNLVEPIWLKERSVGQQNQDFINMTEVDFLPNLNQTTELVWWCWQQEKIVLLGSTTPREVQLRFRKSLTIPQTVNDPIGVILGELYLSYRVAGLALSSVGQPDKWSKTGESMLEMIVAAAVKELQNLPTKRRPYHRGRGRTRVLRDF